jgi:hypothetical protein
MGRTRTARNEPRQGQANNDQVDYSTRMGRVSATDGEVEPTDREVGQLPSKFTNFTDEGDHSALCFERLSGTVYFSRSGSPRVSRNDVE